MNQNLRKIVCFLPFYLCLFWTNLLCRRGCRVGEAGKGNGSFAEMNVNRYCTCKMRTCELLDVVSFAGWGLAP